jgi:hypothetical protein
MALPEAERNAIHDYCIRDLPGDIEWHMNEFRFIPETELRKRLGRAFYTARYIYKLGEALSVSGDEQHAFVKFQIMQYASIYEAVISNLLWGSYRDHPAVVALESHEVLTEVSGFSKSVAATFDGKAMHAAIYKTKKKLRNNIAFGDKVDCAVKIGLVDDSYAKEIKELYTLRNLAHIENEAHRQIEVEIEQSKKAYWRMQPFLQRINALVRPGPVKE